MTRMFTGRTYRPIRRFMCVLLLMLSCIGCLPRGTVLSTQEYTNGALTLRKTQYHVKPAALDLGACYTALDVDAGSGQWQELLAWGLDDPFPVEVIFVNDRVVYAFGRAVRGST